MMRERTTLFPSWTSPVPVRSPALHESSSYNALGSLRFDGVVVGAQCRAHMADVSCIWMLCWMLCASVECDLITGVAFFARASSCALFALLSIVLRRPNTVSWTVTW